MPGRWLQPLARAALLWEAAWPRLWPLAGLVGLFLLLALSGLLPLLPGWLHGLVLAAFALAALVLAVRSFRGFSWPDRTAAQRRLERDSALLHRPVSGLDDRPAGSGDDTTSTHLWQLHQQRLRARMGPLKLASPRAGWARVDRFGLRAALALLLLVAFIITGSDWPQRLQAALDPAAPPGDAVESAQLEAWISTPNYVARAPIYLTEEKTRIRVPEGSRLSARVTGGRDTPMLELAGTESAFQPAGNDGFRIESPVRRTGRLSIEQDGRQLGQWSLEIEADQPPTAGFREGPAPSRREALQFAWQAEDDHGLADLQLKIRPTDTTGPDDASAETLALPLSLPQGRPARAEGRGFEDLTAHPWAGRPVQAWLEAEDARGQRGRSERVELTLPERRFTHPVAKALIEQRRRLIVNPKLHFWVARQLGEIGADTRAYDNDILVALAIRSAEQRLQRDRSSRALDEVQRLLWETALHLEEGEAALAEQNLRELQKELQEALDSGASEEEVERLMDALAGAMERYLRSMMEEALREAREGDLQKNQNFQSGQQSIRPDQLQDMLDQARELMQSGARDEAQAMLEQLQSILENLEMRAGPSSEMQQQMQQSREMMNRLQDIMRGQSELLDQSFRQSREGDRSTPSPQGQPGNRQDGQGSQGDERLSQAAEAQDALRRQLGELMRDYGNMTGELPQPLGRAETRMRDARDALQQGRPDPAGEAQADALDQLQQGLDSLLENFARQMGQGAPRGAQGPPGSESGEGRDPLGRRYGGEGRQGESVELPEAGELQRAREILNELRQRSGQRNRPELERNYLDRLLEQF